MPNAGQTSHFQHFLWQKVSKNLVQTNHYNDVVLLNKPIAVGVTILELVNYFHLCWDLNLLQEENLDISVN